MKRFFVILLLLLVSAATLTPCCSFDDCASEHASAGHEQDDKGDGSCSPFFACATCPGFVSTSKAIQLPQPPLVPGLQHAARETFTPPQPVYRSFWQPPRT
ncbi:MAG: hypothetical protein EOO11_20050 [Chitinophagaceae bacterium]|nr:MAG: hypothetical protein EOO11_20050 [Chitinophagaceae bacterium]